jgi:hypothetical protein
VRGDRPTPLKECNLYRKTLPKRLGPSIGLVIRGPRGEAERRPELDIQSQNGGYIFGPSDSIPRLLTLGESRY